MTPGKKPLQLAGVLLLCWGALACSTPRPGEPLSLAPSAARPTALTREMAWLRSKQVGKVAYSLWFGLDDQNDSYEGRVVVNFELKDFKRSMPAEVLQELKSVIQVVMLDFEGGTIGSISINGAPVSPDSPPGAAGRFARRYDGHHIYFHTSEFAPGENRIEISFTQRFSSRGEGFHRFKDPADGAVYLYTDSEPYNAHRIFPCFDQPDLKASYEVTVEAPEDWQVISNTLERDVTRVDGRKSWAFPPSPVFSTYLFEVAAGPYAMWKSDAHGLPLRLFARRSLKPYIDANEWFETTRHGLDFYTTYFGYPYPYAKLDQIVVPEFNAGAMENVAAITFSERMIYRTRVTEKQLRGRAGAILHEMAHQWFGDLVTMRWWNGLWLNESFATYMSSKALSQDMRFSGVWENFYSGEKSWAYREDQLVTTHPVEGSIADTDAALSSFDGITYGKGASVLKQLAFYLGEDDFREGLQRYFMRYALRNTTTHDLIKTLSEASGKDLSSWQKLWLETSGVNGLRADWACGGNGKISRFDLVQSPATEGNPVLRPHRTRIALFGFSKNGEKVEPRPKDVFDIMYSGARTTVSQALGRPCPRFVFPNYDDYDYAKVELDPTSLRFARKNLNHFENSFVRQVVWSSLWDEVVDGKLQPQEMLSDILRMAPSEKDPDVLSHLLDWSTSLHDDSTSLLEYLPPSLRAKYLPRVEAMALQGLHDAPAGTDLQRTWFSGMLQVANSPSALAHIRRLLDGKTRIPKLAIEQPERWNLIFALARGGERDAASLIAAELKRDPTDLGVRAAISAEAAMPDPASRKRWLGYFLTALNGKPLMTDGGIPLNASRLREAAGSYVSLLREQSLKDLVEPFFTALPKLKDLSQDPYAGTFARLLYPSLCEDEIAQKTSNALAKLTQLSPGIRKTLKIHRQDVLRCIRARALAEGLASSTSP